MILSSSRTARALLLGAVLAFPPATAAAHPFVTAVLAPTARERSQLLLAEGEAAYAKEHLEEAISKYRASYYGLSPDDQASYLGSLPVRKAMRSYDQLIASEQDPVRRRALLQSQRLLLGEFLDAVANKEGAAEEVGEDVIAELEEKRRSLDEVLDGVPKPSDPEPSPSPPLKPEVSPRNPEPPTKPPITDQPPSPKRKRDWLGLGLVIGGGTTLLAGGGVSIGYVSIRNGANATVRDAMGDPDDDKAYLDREYARAKKYLIAGSVIGGVGLAVVVGGAVRLALHRRRTSKDDTTLRLAPVLTPTTAGLTVHRRF